jgi:hypothetical protein
VGLTCVKCLQLLQRSLKVGAGVLSHDRRRDDEVQRLQEDNYI